MRRFFLVPWTFLGGGLAAGLLGILLYPSCAGPGTERAPALRAGPLEERLDGLLATPGFTTAHLGVVVKDLATGRVLLDHQGERAFLPASNMKLFTGALALDRLGPAWQARTSLYRRGEIRNGVLEGDLVLQGGGDPTLGRGRDPLQGFREWGRDLFARGLRRVTGRVVAVTDLFSDPPLGEGWAWDDRAYAWSAPFGALVFHESVVDLVLKPLSVGAPPVLEEIPSIPGALRVSNRCVTVSEGGRGLRVVRCEDPPGALLQGALPLSGGRVRWSFPVEDPGLFAVQALKQAFQEAGIRIEGPAVAAGGIPGFRWKASPGTLLAGRVSPPLAKMVEEMFLRSQNLFAEILFRLAGRGRTGRPASAEAARKALAALLDRMGVDRDGLVAADGSGLSRLDQVTPRQAAGLLEGALKESWGEDFLQALPLAGSSGTLARRFRGTRGEGRIRAKTGTLTRVAALSGYILREGKPVLVFSWLIQGFTAPQARARAEMDRFLENLAGRIH